MEQIHRFYIDTEEEYQDRISSYLQTLPFLVKDGKKVEDSIKKYSKTFSEFIEEYHIPIEYIDTYLQLWLLYDKESEQEIFYGYPSLQEVVKRYKLEFDFKTFSKKVFQEQLDKKIKTFQKKVKEIEKQHRIIEETDKKKYTPFKKQKYCVYFPTQLQDLSLSYVFNTLQCTKHIPFCSYNSICKVNKRFNDEIVKTWTDTLEDKITLKINVGDTFIDSFLFLDSGHLKIEICIDMLVTIDIKSCIKEIFTQPIEFGENVDEHDIYGIFMFPQQRFNKYIFSDMIMNNPILYKFLCVDESVKASTKKSGLLLKFRGNDKDVSCNIICKKVDKHDIDVKDYHKKDFPVGSYYVKVRLTNFKNNEYIEKFIYLLSTFLTIYEKDEVSVYNEYKKVIKTFTLEEEEEIIETNELKDIAPDLFMKGYNRICPYNRHPSIISKEEIGEMEEYKDYIMYPKETGLYYQCKNEQYPYIGLLDNTLPNMERYEYIPCCYKTMKHNIDEYFLNKEVVVKNQQNIIKTLDRLLEPSYYGEIPKNLEIFLSTVYETDLFYRKGVSTGTRSFLECVMHATGKKNKPTRFEIASQENPDLNIDQLSDLYHNKDVYMDPRRWIRLLEHVYECNIHVFYRHGKSKDVQLMIPYHKPPYLTYKPVYEKTVIILENQNNRTKEMRCELITSKQTFFPHPIQSLITQFYMKSNGKKPLIKSMLSPMSYSFSDQYKYQILDSYKKTRCIVTKNDVFLLCDPIPPLDLPIQETSSTESDPDNVNEFMETFEKELQDSIFHINVKEKRVHKNDIKHYLKHKKIAFVLGQLFMYLFSIFSKDTDTSIQTIKRYIDTMIVLQPTTYKPVSSSLIDMDELEENGYITHQKLIVQDTETLKRLVCLLRLNLTNSLHLVKTYHTQHEFIRFYQKVSDYDSSHDLIIYSTDLSKIENGTHIVYKEFQYVSVYYLRLRGNLYLVKTIDTIDENEMYYIHLYNKQLQLIETKGFESNKELHLIEYDDEYKTEDKKITVKKYQQMFKLI